MSKSCVAVRLLQAACLFLLASELCAREPLEPVAGVEPDPLRSLEPLMMTVVLGGAAFLAGVVYRVRRGAH